MTRQNSCYCVSNQSGQGKAGQLHLGGPHLASCRGCSILVVREAFRILSKGGREAAA